MQAPIVVATADMYATHVCHVRTNGGETIEGAILSRDCNPSIGKLTLADGSTVTDDQAISNAQSEFYKNLYSMPGNLDSSVEGLNNFMTHANTLPKLSTEERDSLEGPLTKQECESVLRSIANNKSPGTDGFPVEFYKFFWQDIGEYVVRALNSAYYAGQMSISQRRGIITCIPKPNKNRFLLKNWRPITLLNTDYKIASGVIANRMKKVLPNIIGFVKGRFIGKILG